MKKPARPNKRRTQLDLLRDMTTMRTELMESEKLRDRMSAILRQVADALHGGPLEDGYWSWHDLPELATKQYADVTALKDKLRTAEAGQAALALYLRTQPDPIKVKAGTAYADMVETCQKSGLTPLSPEEFAAEDKLLLRGWNRRRHGLDDETGRPKVDFGTYGSIGPCIRTLPLKKQTFLERIWAVVTRRSPWDR